MLTAEIDVSVLRERSRCSSRAQLLALCVLVGRRPWSICARLCEKKGMGCGASCGGHWSQSDYGNCPAPIELRHSKPARWAKLPPPARKYIDPNPPPKEEVPEDHFFDGAAAFELKTLAALFNQFDASGDGFLQVQSRAPPRA